MKLTSHAKTAPGYSAGYTHSVDRLCLTWIHKPNLTDATA